MNTQPSSTNRRLADIVVGIVIGAAVVGLVVVLALRWDSLTGDGGSPADAGAALGTLEVRSEPPGATVTVNGVAHPQRTPATVERVAFDEIHHLEISLPGHVSQAIDAHLSAKKPHVVIQVVLAREAEAAAPPARERRDDEVRTRVDP